MLRENSFATVCQMQTLKNQFGFFFCFVSPRIPLSSLKLSAHAVQPAIRNIYTKEDVLLNRDNNSRLAQIYSRTLKAELFRIIQYYNIIQFTEYKNQQEQCLRHEQFMYSSQNLLVLIRVQSEYILLNDEEYKFELNEDIQILLFFYSSPDSSENNYNKKAIFQWGPKTGERKDNGFPEVLILVTMCLKKHNSSRTI